MEVLGCGVAWVWSCWSMELLGCRLAGVWSYLGVELLGYMESQGGVAGYRVTGMDSVALNRSSFDVCVDICRRVSVIAATMISPIELVRTKMQSTQFSYRQIGKAISMSVSHGGWLSLWAGLGPTLLRDIPFSGE